MYPLSEDATVKTIMVVDDEPDVTESIKMVFEGAPPRFNVLCANSGSECIELLEKKKLPDLILLDIMMPGMSGWDVQKQLQEHPKWKDIPVVFLTAVPERGIKDTTSFTGVDYFEKPVDVLDLKRQVRNILRRKKK